MGMYTALVLACELKAETAVEAIETFKLWSGTVEKYPPQGLWWYNALDAHSASFPGLAHHSVEYKSLESENDIAYITIRISRINYWAEIETFLVWLAPYSETEGFVGYIHREGVENPELIFFREGKAIRKECVSFTESVITTPTPI